MRERNLNLGTALSKYTSPANGSYDPAFDAQVRARFPLWFEDTAAKNKAALLAMEPGSPRPVQKKHPLGQLLTSYTNGTNKSYDAAFDAAIRAKHPDWFEDTAAKNKAALLAMEPGSPRPSNKKHPLGSPLCCYTSKNRDTYDAEFTAAISARFPHWFEEFSAKKMSDLLAMSLDSPRPSKKTHPLGPALVAYTNKPKPGRGSRSIYNPAFDAAIRARFPHWFEDTVVRNKADLLALPPGSPRPVERKHPLGKVLNHYITKPEPGARRGSYDPEFDAAIRAKHPGWFEDTAARNKADLLAMEPGSPRPHSANHPLGRALSNYTSRAAYDPIFDAAIHARFPHWFRDKTLAEKKAELLAMPPDSPRPQSTKHPLGASLNCYIRKPKSGGTPKSYDPEFDAAIRARFPHWFKD